MLLSCAHRRGQAAGDGLHPQVLWRSRWDGWIAVKGKDGPTWIGLACQLRQRVHGTTATPPAGYGEDRPQSAALLKPDDLDLRSSGCTTLPIEPGGQIGDGWLLEQDPHGNSDAEVLFKPGDNRHALQRVGSQIDEILVEPDVRQPQLCSAAIRKLT